jgi:leucyl-tRNA synthetase
MEATEEVKSSRRKDFLVSIEKEMQEKWEAEKIYEANAPQGFNPENYDFDAKNAGKFFTTFPYPYMNGRLHLGHGFSMSKCEFRTRYERLKGKNTLFPFAFHCTGMPIAAAAKKLRQEFEDPTKEIKGKKQSEILEEVGVPKEIIPEFQVAERWLQYFPEFGRSDLKKFGLAVDWRRSFYTTSHN